MNSSAPKDADRAKLHQSRSFIPNLSEPALVGGSLLTLEKAQEKKERKKKEKINKFKSSQNQPKVFENGAKKMKRKLENFQDQDHAKNSSGNSNWKFELKLTQNLKFQNPIQKISQIVSKNRE